MRPDCGMSDDASDSQLSVQERRARKERKREKKEKRSKKHRTAAVTSQWGTYGIISEAE